MDSVAVPRNYLCEALGETDRPVARICKTRAEVQQFFIDEWMGDKDSGELPPAMKLFDEHDWGDGPLEWEFEIGGVSVKWIYESVAAPAVKPDAVSGERRGLPSDEQDSEISKRIIADFVSIGDEANAYDPSVYYNTDHKKSYVWIRQSLFREAKAHLERLNAPPAVKPDEQKPENETAAAPVVKPDGAGSYAVPPRWYTKQEIVDALTSMKYSAEIASELSDWFVRHLQAAFNKGFEKGQRTPSPAQPDKDAEIARLPDYPQWFWAHVFHSSSRCIYKNDYDKFRKSAEQQLAAKDAALHQASFCLRELLPNDADAKMTVEIIDKALKGTTP